MNDDRSVTAQLDAYLRDKDPGLLEIVSVLRALMKETVPDVTETINPWGIPTFEFIGPLCYYMVGKRHVTLGFHRGAHLGDPSGVLEATGKGLRHVKLRKVEDLNRGGLRDLVEAAARLNREQPEQRMQRRRRS